MKKYKFNKLDNIGTSDAEDDLYLKSCYIDTGDLNVLRDCSNPKRIIVGRTGSGKTAILLRLKEEEQNVIEIHPESLALAYISNSTILNFFLQLGVNLDIFFKLLWRHVFTVEIIKSHFNIDNESGKKSFIENIYKIFRSKKHQKAIEYLEDWGKKFWEETEYRIKEVTKTLEDNLKESTKTIIPNSLLSLENINKITEEQKSEIVQRAQYVVNKVQIRQLSDIFVLIDDILDDPQKKYYLTIDRLDENWIEDRFRYKLIRALIETTRDFRKIRHAKIIIALRIDLIYRVFRMSRYSGFQEEKYESLYLDLKWNKDKLFEILNSRLNFLIKKSRNDENIIYKDILPKKIQGIEIEKYILDRTFYRPRDVILFVNECIKNATNSSIINASTVKRAEVDYSHGRLKSLADEWYADYPNLLEFSKVLRQKNYILSIKDITDKECEEFCLNFLTGDYYEKDDIFSTNALNVVDFVISPSNFKVIVFKIFYKIGLVSLKFTPYEKSSWLLDGKKSISSYEISENTRVTIQPSFYRALGIKTH